MKRIVVAGCTVLMLAVAAIGHADCVNPKSFGAAGDGKADDTSAIQSAIGAAIDQTHRGRTVCLAAGDYRVTRTIVVDDVQGIRVIGDGGATRLIWDGDDKSPLLLLSSVQNAEIRAFQIIALDAHVLDAGIQCITRAGALHVSRHNLFAGIRIDGITSGVRKGFQIGGGGMNANNDFHVFENCSVANYRDVAYSIENTQVYGLLFMNCQFDGGTRSQVGVANDRGVSRGGNFTWIGGGGGGNAVADFTLGAPNGGAISIANAIFEKSARFLTTGGPSAASFLLDVNGIRWSGDALAADGIAIDFRYPGPLTIRSSRIGEYADKALRISWMPGLPAEAAVFVFEGNAVRRAAGTPLFVGRPPTRATDNVVSGS